jgi:hypothetical protein
MHFSLLAPMPDILLVVIIFEIIFKDLKDLQQL